MPTDINNREIPPHHLRLPRRVVPIQIIRRSRSASLTAARTRRENVGNDRDGRRCCSADVVSADARAASSGGRSGDSGSDDGRRLQGDGKGGRGDGVG